MDVLQSLSSPSPCPHLYGSGNVSLIRQHYNWTGRLRNRPSERDGMGASKVCFLLISVFIMAENLLVLLAVLFRIRKKGKIRWVYICIANITLSDLLTGGAYVLNLSMSGKRTFGLSPTQWLFREGVLFVALAASIFSLLLIAVERYTTMMSPNQKPASNTYRIYGLVALCWLLAFAIGFLPMVGWNCVCQPESCSTLLPLYSKSYILFSLVIFFIILLAIGVLYGAIYWHVRGSAKRSRDSSLRLLKTVVSIVGAFMLCWGPLFILLLVDFFCQSASCSPLHSADWVIAMAVLNSALNPVIYVLGSAELRKAITSLLFCRCVTAGSLASEEAISTSGALHRQNSLRNSFNRVQSTSTSPAPPRKTKKPRLSSTTSCLSSVLID